MPDVAVVNSSPLIFLAKAGRLELFQQIGATRVAVPDSVFREVTTGGHSDVAAQALLDAAWIERCAPTAIPARVANWDLGDGESAVIAAALELPDSAAIIDDLSGRRCARACGVPLMGTLGVVHE